MKKIKPVAKIYLADSKIPDAGRGVFAATNIKQGEVIERAPVLILPRKDYPLAKKTILRNYYFMWGKTTSALCLGFGMLYNHSYEPNVTYQKFIKEKLIEFTALNDIKKGEELTYNYNYGNPNDKSPLWIDDIKPIKYKSDKE